MFKRIICSLSVMSVLFTSTITSYAVLPQNMSGSGQQQGPILVFHDDFTHGSGLWKISNMTMTNGKITCPDSTSSNIKFYDEAVELTDADYFIKFSPVNYNTGLAIIDIGTDPKYRVIIRESGVSLAPVGGTEQPRVDYPLSTGTTYELRISEASGAATISIRKEGEDEYTSLGMVSGTDRASGMLTLSGNKYAIDFKDVKVFDTSSKSMAFTERYRFVNINEPTELDIINKTEICINTRYFMPDLTTSFFSFSKITRKNELKDIISQQIKNINAFCETTTISIEANKVVKYIKCEFKLFFST